MQLWCPGGQLRYSSVNRHTHFHNSKIVGFHLLLKILGPGGTKEVT